MPANGKPTLNEPETSKRGTRGAGTRPGPDRAPDPDKRLILPPTAEGLRAWRGRMKLSRARASVDLGCSRTAYQRWEDGLALIPKYIALACAAIERKISAIK